MPVVESTDGLPADLRDAQPLWEVYRSGGRPGTDSARRLYDDGQIYTWSNSRRVRSGGSISRTPAPYAWRLDAQISPDGLEQVRQLIRDGFMGLADEPVPTAPDQGSVTWRAHLDGADHSVTRPAGPTADLPAAIRAVEEGITRAIVPGGVPVEQP